MRLQYPPSVRVVRFPCTGKIEPNFILSAFELGADGIIVAGASRAAATSSRATAGPAEGGARATADARGWARA